MNTQNNMAKMPTAEIVKGLGARFKEYRIAAMMTQAEVAERAGVSLPTIKRFELGLTFNITMGNFIALLKAIDCADGLTEILPEIPPSLHPAVLPKRTIWQNIAFSSLKVGVL